MTTYVDVALEEIREEYPIAYKILKDAVLPEYKPFLEEKVHRADGHKGEVRVYNSPQLIINCPEVESVISYNGLVEGYLNLGGDIYYMNNLYKSSLSTKHQLIFELEKITKE